MGRLPDTRHSLLIRLKDHSDQSAWTEFVSIYQPFVMSLIRRQGLQEADAQEACQDLMMTVARTADSWQGDRSHRSFRAWLYRVSKNLVINYATRPKHQPQSPGGSAIGIALANLIDPSSDPNTAIETEYRRHLFTWAAQRVRPQFAEATWRAFWLTSVDGVSPSEAARRLGVSTGKIYVSKCRVMARLREAVESWTQSPDIPSG